MGSVRLQTQDNYLADLYIDDNYYSEAFMLREDILFENANNVIVLDTKYKLIDKLSNALKNHKLDILDSDVKQMAIYGVKRNADKLVLLYPMRKNESYEDTKIVFNLKLGNFLKEIPLYIIKVPFIFGDEQSEQLSRMKEIISRVIN